MIQFQRHVCKSRFAKKLMKITTFQVITSLPEVSLSVTQVKSALFKHRKATVNKKITAGDVLYLLRGVSWLFHPKARAAGLSGEGQPQASLSRSAASFKKSLRNLIIRSNKSVKIELDLFVTFWIFFAEQIAQNRGDDVIWLYKSLKLPQKCQN